MNKKKIFVLAVLTVFVLGMAMSSACAASTSMGLKKNAYTSKKVSSSDKIYSYYCTKKSTAYEKGVTVEVMDKKKGAAKNTVMSKAKVYYKNNKNKKIVCQTKSAMDNGVYFKPKKGYTPYKVTAYYKKVKKMDMA